MAANSSRTRVPSTIRSSHENRFIGWENIAVVFQDKDGTIKATGAGLFRDTRSWFTQDFRERFQDVLPSGQPNQFSSCRPVKCCRASVDNPDKRKAAVEVLSDYSNTQQATAQYWQIFTSCPQNEWRVIEVTMQSQSGGHVDSNTKHHIILTHEIIAIRKNEEEVETQRNNDGITATRAPDEEPN
ncbi:hypothetical protein KXV78_000750 [Aspergillus fumigatus]|nr:hypothetical protein KXV78_000750 [Aspergillus fumigatus]